MSGARGLWVAVLVLLLLAASAEARTLRVTAAQSGSEYFFLVEGIEGRNPPLRLEPGEEVTVHFGNAGTQYHNLRIGPPVDEATALLPPGGQETLEFTVPADADFASQYWCEPHKNVGMVGPLLFGDAEAPSAEVPVPLPLMMAAVLLAAWRHGAGRTDP